MSQLTFGGAVAAHRQLFALRLRRRAVLWIALGLCALVPVLGAALTFFRAGGRNTFTECVELELLLLPFLPLLFAASLVGEELERHTSDFVLARPVPRATLIWGRLSALWPVAAAAVAGIVLAFCAAFALAPSDGISELDYLGRAAAATAVGFLAYSGLAVLFSTLFPRHTVVALGGYIVVVEIGVAGLPVVLQWLAISWHLANVAGVQKASAVGWAPNVPPLLSALLVLASAIGCALWAIRRLDRAEPRGDG